MNALPSGIVLMALLLGLQVGGCGRRTPQPRPATPAQPAPATDSPEAIRVLLYPVEDLRQVHLETASAALQEAYGAAVEVRDSASTPTGAYDARRKQYLASAFLEALDGISGEATGEAKLLAVTALDLYAPDLNFVFGQAQMGGRAAVVSVARLDPRFFGDEPDEDLLAERLTKETVHEVGHCLGLRHCPNPRCVMHFSNSLADTDAKKAQPCDNCRRRIAR